MTQYACVQLSTSVPQVCEAWSEQVTVLDQIAITRADAQALTVQIVTLFIICYCYQLFKQFLDKA